MNNFMLRIVFVGIGILFVVSLIMNHRLNKDLVVPVTPAVVFVEEQPSSPAVMRVEQKDYDPFSNYAPVPTGEGLQEEVFETKKVERVPDAKIIYEMPTSNKVLLQ